MRILDEIRLSVEEEGELTFDLTKNCSKIGVQTSNKNSTERMVRVHS